MRKVLVDGGVDPACRPIWIEGPHLIAKDGWYYLICAEGGTAVNHSQVVLRSRRPGGPYTPGANPVLTQRDLPDGRPYPVTSAGHADLVTTSDGGWWASLLAVRRPNLPRDRSALATSGAFAWREEFDRPLGPEWLMMRNPRERWYDLRTRPGRHAPQHRQGGRLRRRSVRPSCRVVSLFFPITQQGQELA